MDPILLTAIKTFLTDIIKEVIPNKDINVELTIKINISNPKKEEDV